MKFTKGLGVRSVCTSALVLVSLFFAYGDENVVSLDILNPEANANTGKAVATSGDFAVIGQPNADMERGKVLIYHKEGGLWVLKADIQPYDVAIGDHFGASVAIDSVFVVVGAPDANFGTGAAYTIEIQYDGEWFDFNKVNPHYSSITNLLEEGDKFGSAVAVRGRLFAVSATGDDGTDNVGPENCGAIYSLRYKANGTSSLWGDPITVPEGMSMANDEFGTSVDYQGQTIIGGAPKHDGNNGTAYIFSYSTEESTWNMEMFNNDNAAGGAYGTSVAIQGRIAAVGAPEKAARHGKVYIYQKNSNGIWRKREVMADKSGGRPLYGAAVSLASVPGYGVFLVVGAPTDEICGLKTGSAYFYYQEDANFLLIDQLTAGSEMQADEEFGAAVSIDTHILIGAPQKDATGELGILSGAGDAYIFEL